ncbi:hypothetical protein [Mastigocoleus sp. MO_188.B34]|uniref:hypothetical protein n=1 Tax=Mastigocoleus sp. MO_188.B34 TaxID=3036635 RepID=UPI002615D99A|nr:hypothetical protein [Mastigocoleus sp. MO_188.B34]MDJ0695777.1 hypothetical protein [Mastigocoleus sp. MO_188.B34]
MAELSKGEEFYILLKVFVTEGLGEFQSGSVKKALGLWSYSEALSCMLSYWVKIRVQIFFFSPSNQLVSFN